MLPDRYVSFPLLAERHGALEAASGDLTPYEARCFSQNGEDGVIAELLRRCGSGPRWFVEFGVGAGNEGNCVLLADMLGWSGLFMEADPAQFGGLQRKYGNVERVRTVQATVGPENIDELLGAAGVPREIDVLSIDVDGIDYWIWDAIEAVEPRIVVVEYNSALDPTRRVTKPKDAREKWDETDYFGASLGALSSLAERKGLRLAYTDLSGANAFFVREGLTTGLPAPDEVEARAPNYHLSGLRLARDPQDRPWWDLDAERLVRVERDSPPSVPPQRSRRPWRRRRR